MIAHDAQPMTGHDALPWFDGAGIRAWRAFYGISQAELGQLLDVPSDTIAKWERGDVGIRHPRILALALAHLETLTKH